MNLIDLANNVVENGGSVASTGPDLFTGMYTLRLYSKTEPRNVIENLSYSQIEEIERHFDSKPRVQNTHDLEKESIMVNALHKIV